MEAKYAIPDLHSHILPRMDDGSRSAEMTRGMLDAMWAQGVRQLAATPHFYATNDGIDRFLTRRAQAVTALQAVYDPAVHPALVLGAEVAYFHGISHADQIRAMAYQGSPFILIEMPFTRWEDSVIEELLAIREELDLQPIVAHVERYIFQQKHGTLPMLLENGILIQSNAEFFLDSKTRKKALKLLERGEIQFLGSDSHNLLGRKPNLGEAIKVIEQAGLADALRELESAGQALFARMEPMSAAQTPAGSETFDESTGEGKRKP